MNRRRYKGKHDKPRKRRKKSNIKPSDLVKFINNLSLKRQNFLQKPVTAKALKNPKAPTIQKIYELLVTEILGKEINYQQEVSRFKDSNSDPSRSILFFNHIKQAFRILKLKDIKLSDIHNPSWKRLSIHLSEAVNFLNFKKEFQQRSDTLTKDREERLQKISNFEEELNNKQTETKAIKNKIKTGEPELAQRSKILEDCNEVHFTKQERQARCEGLQSKLSNVRNKINYETKHKNKSEARYAVLEASAAEDPERIANNLKQAEKDFAILQKNKLESRALEQKYRDRLTEDGSMKDYFAEKIKAFRVHRDLKKANDDAKKEDEDAKSEVKSLQRQQDDAKKQVYDYSQKKESHLQKKIEMAKSFAIHIQQLKKKLNQKLDARRRLEQSMEDKRNQIVNLRKTKQDLQDGMETAIKTFEKEILEIEAEVKEIDEIVMQDLTEFRECFWDPENEEYL